MTDDRVAKLVEEATALRWNRRQILKRAAALGLSAPAISLVLAACGGDDDDDGDTTATQPAGGATTPAGSPTTAGATPSGQPTPPAGQATQATSQATPMPTEGRGGIINVPDTQGDNGIGNPILNSSNDWIEFLAFSRLFINDDMGSLQPQLAEEWTFSEDGMELTITLKEATWHDGEAFNADDVIFTFDTILEESTDTPHRSKLTVAGEPVQYEMVDDRTVKLTTVEPFAPFLFALSQIAIIPEHALSGSADINTDPFNLAPIGTGWFKVVEYAQSEFIRMERFDDHFDGPAAADGFTVFFHEDTDATDAALRAGDLDMMFTPPEAQPAWEDADGYTLRNYVYYTPITIGFNFKHPILQDYEVRRAIAMGVDKETLTETVTKGRGLVAHNQFADTGPLDRYNDYDNVTKYEYNVDEANKILDDAGYTMGGDGVREAPDGTKLSFTIITYSGFEEYVNDQNILQSMLAEVGIELVPQVVDFATLEQMWADPNDDPNNRAIELEEWPHPTGEFDPDLHDELHSRSLPPNGLNYMWFQDDECDQLIDQGRSEVDPDKRAEIYKQLDVRRSELLPALPLYIAVDGWVTSDNVLGIADTPYFRQYRWVSPNTWYKEA